MKHFFYNNYPYEIFFKLSILISNSNYIIYNTLEIPSSIKNAIRVISIFLLCVSIILSNELIKFSKKDFRYVAFIAISLVSFSISNNFINFVFIYLLLISAQNINRNELINWMRICLIIGLLQTILFHATGLISNYRYTVEGRTRNTLGFGNVNAFSAFFYATITIITLSIKQKNERIKVLIILLVSTIIYSLTDTRTTFYAILIQIAFSYLFKLCNNLKSPSKKLVISSIVYISISIPILFTFFMPLIFPIFPQLDIILSLRPTRYTNYISSQNFFNFIIGGTKVQDIDNGYLLLFFNTGILFFIFIIFRISRTVKYYLEIGHFKMISFIISFIYVNAFEGLIIRPELVVSSLFWIIIFYPSSKEDICYAKNDFSYARETLYTRSQYRN